MIYLKTMAYTIIILVIMFFWFYAIGKAPFWLSTAMASLPLVAILAYTVYLNIQAHERKKS